MSEVLLCGKKGAMEHWNGRDLEPMGAEKKDFESMILSNHKLWLWNFEDFIFIVL